MGILLSNIWFLSILAGVIGFALLLLTYRAGFMAGKFHFAIEKQLLQEQIRQLSTRADYLRAYNDSLLRRLLVNGAADARNLGMVPPNAPYTNERRVYGDGLLSPVDEQRKTVELRRWVDSFDKKQNEEPPVSVMKMPKNDQKVSDWISGNLEKEPPKS